jgi:hypothetical protein
VTNLPEETVQVLCIDGVIYWHSLEDAVAYIAAATNTNYAEALRKLRSALAAGRVAARWGDAESQDGHRPGNAVFWENVSIRMANGGEVLHQKYRKELIKSDGEYSVRQDQEVRWRPLLIAAGDLRRLWPLAEVMIGSNADVSESRSSALPRRRTSKSEIHEVAREVYTARAANPPNMIEAPNLIRERLPAASRQRIREVLREPEFANLRRPSGVRKQKACQKSWPAKLQAIDCKASRAICLLAAILPRGEIENDATCH